jgi:DNA-binding response OmpR family regulator
MRILSIDDEILLTFTVERKLSLQNYEVKTANSGAEGIRLFDAFDPQLVILDYNMPGLNGLDVLKHIRFQRKSNVPVLLLSGTQDQEQLSNSFHLGITSFMGKPLDFHELLAKVKQIAEADPGIGPTHVAVG